MTVPSQENQVQVATEAQKANDVESNLVKQRKHYERQLEEQRVAREAAEARAAELERMTRQAEDDTGDSEPYVDHKSLKKTLDRFGQETKQQTQTEIKQAVQAALSDERKNNWLKQNPDFYDVLQHAEAFAQKDPELAETILQMPEGFERQKLVYRNIKALGLHKPPEKQSSIQEKIDANRKSPYYQPSGVATSPYASQGDFSASGQKNAYAKLQELKNRLRI